MLVPIITFLFFSFVSFIMEKYNKCDHLVTKGMYNMGRMRGKTCIVIGASRGIGRGIALGLGEAGAHVIAVDDNCILLQELYEEILSYGGQCTFLNNDMNQSYNISAIFSAYPNADMCIIATYGAGYELVNTMNKVPWDISKHDPGDFWDKVNNMGLRTNYIASTEYCRSASSDKKHVLINVSSWAGQMPIIDSAYGIGKAGLDRLGTEFHIAGKFKNVSSIILYPGLITTETIADTLQYGTRYDMETPLYSGRVMPYLYEYASSYSGKIAITAEVAKSNNIYDEYGKQPLSLRSIRSILNKIPILKYFSWFIQCDLYIPFQLIQLISIYGIMMNY